jgi:hypothetical protein
MAVTKTVLKNANHESAVKVAGTAASATIDISTDLVASTQVASGTQTVTINRVQIIASDGATVTVARNSVNIMTFAGPICDTIEFDMLGFTDNIEDDQDIVVTIAGAEAQIYLLLRKTGGYAPKSEVATYGAYDNEAAQGS